jgi:dipeptidyl-peptidase III
MSKTIPFFGLILALVMGGSLKLRAQAPEGEDGSFVWQTEQFADLRILRYQVPGFDELPLNKKKLLYYLSEAALSGRDMIYDQNYRHNLYIRRTLEAIVRGYQGERMGPDWEAFLVFTKRIWFSNGIHHHYSSKKIDPGFPSEYLRELIRHTDATSLPLLDGQTVEQLTATVQQILFDPGLDAKRVNQDAGGDLVADSANNYYEGLTQAEVEAFYAQANDPSDATPISHGLNSKLIKKNGQIYERTWKVGGMYSQAIEQVVRWLEKAVTVAENDKQKKAMELLIAFYRTGQLRVFDNYSIAWVQDIDSDIDVINGFIEVYGDAMGYRGAFESVVSIRDPIATKRIATIGGSAQWFEDHSPIQSEHKKKEVTGISAKVISVVMESGDSSPSTPIGINLPNANWIRATKGSKSVSLGNIVRAHNEASKTSGLLEEFAFTQEEVALSRKWASLALDLEVDMHEVIGHASGQINPGVGTPKETLKAYGSTLEEARADLVALYYMMDPKLIELGLMPALDVGRVAYDGFLKNGLLVQLLRLDLGDDIEEAHMRNRQLIAKWVMERAAGVAELTRRDGKTYVVIHDYAKLRELFGRLLREIQRIKSEGDYEAGKALVETYGVKVDPEIHREVLERVKPLNIAPYSGFINPKLTPIRDAAGGIMDVKIEYPQDFTRQHLEYSESHSFLPTYN